MMGRLMALSLLGSVAVVGCSGHVRELTRAETEALSSVAERLAANRAAVAASLEGLAKLSAEALSERDMLSSNVAKAQLLESMRSPWTGGQGEDAATRREVALYHLYALADAERELRTARIRERAASVAAVQEAYDRLAALVADAADAEASILRYLERPRGARVSEAIDGLLSEARAFRQQLVQSDDPELQRLAEQVARGEDAVAKAKALIERSIEKAKGGGERR
ncbi:MAG: hypothetical protein H6744_15115 [Deltaproteobacteria bacterium]|nr:hypothetical protein [Deltaproteobacteria bacterium]MCB9788011.1 hypothetical protein [Deltaproteobacteria bacterium]